MSDVSMIGTGMMTSSAVAEIPDAAGSIGDGVDRMPEKTATEVTFSSLLWIGKCGPEQPVTSLLAAVAACSTAVRGVIRDTTTMC